MRKKSLIKLCCKLKTNELSEEELVKKVPVYMTSINKIIKKNRRVL